MTLLGAGDQRQFAGLKKILQDPKSDDRLKIRLLNQIRQEKIASALPLAQQLAAPEHLLPLRLRAYQTIAAIDPRATELLAKTIEGSKITLLQLNLLRLLSDREDSRKHLMRFVNDPDSLGAATGFELARPGGGAPASQATAKLLKPRHPVVVEYVLARFAVDLKTDKTRAEFYVAPVMDYLRSVQPHPRKMTSVHDHAALAVELLARLGSASAIKGLEEILADQKNRPLRKLTAAALYRCQTPAAGALVRPLLKSPWAELRVYSALLLSALGDRESIPVLLEIQNTASQRGDDVLSLVHWRLLKLAKKPPSPPPISPRGSSKEKAPRDKMQDTKRKGVAVHGFSLVELLVVIAIISLLAGLLAPTLWQMKEIGRQTACQNHQRKLGQGLESYCADHQMRFPGVGSVGGEYWLQQIETYLHVQVPDDPFTWNRNTLPPFLFCPSDEDPFPRPTMGTMEASSYALNGVETDSVSGGVHVNMGLFGGALSREQADSGCMMLAETTNYDRIADLDHPAAIAAINDAGANIGNARQRFHHRATSGFYHQGKMNIYFLGGSCRLVEGIECDPPDDYPYWWPDATQTFFENLRLPTATEDPRFWGPPYQQ